MKKTTIPSVVAAFFVVTTPIFADTIMVSGGGDAIQDAINAASAGDVLVVAPGTYSSINFNGKNITVISANPDDPDVVESTIIDAAGVSSAVTFANGEGPDAVLAGLTITGGYGTLNSTLGEDIYWGAGVYCYQASPTITDNVITGNHGPGGSQDGYGGGIGCLESNAIIARNTIKGNEVFAGAGLMACLGYAKISSNLMYENSAEVGGGAVLLYGGQLINNTIVGNDATVAGNLYGNGQCLILNNIISHGNALEGGGILWEGPVEYDSIAYNNVYGNTGGDYSGLDDQTGFNGNISQDPLLVSPTTEDYHLQSDSPCINAGDPDFAPWPGETDIDGEDRVFAVRVDIGADEYVGCIKPIADAGPDQFFKEIQLVTLDGSGSFFYDPCGVREFQWTQTDGSTVALSDSAAMQPTFMPEVEDEYRFELVVSDDSNTSEPDEVLIAVGNRAPVADAGANTVCEVGEQVSLDGTASYDPDPDDELTYAWTQLEGPNVVLYDANTPTAYFDCNEEGLYAFELVVSDGFEDSEPSVVQVATVALTTNQQDLVITTEHFNHYPDVSGTKVVYAWGGACDFGWDNECQDLATGKVYRWDEPEMLTTKHKVEGDIVVWSGGPVFGEPWYHEPLNIGIFVRNLTTEAQVTLRQYTMSESYSHPAISGNMVVWLEHLNLDTTPIGSELANNWYNTPYNICGADISDLSSPKYFTIAENVGRRDPYAWADYPADFDDVIDISGNIVVWEAEGDIYGADISDFNDIKVFPICTDPARQSEPVISRNIVLWTDRRNDAGDIYGADISDLENIEAFELIRAGGTQEQPAIDGYMIVYIDVTDGLHGGEIRACCLTKHYGAVDIELSVSHYGMGPAVDGDIIIWQDDYFGKARGMSLEVAYSIVDGAIENLTAGKRYDYIQHAINAATGGDEVAVPAGIYHESINFKGKSLTVRSTDPEDRAVVAATIINGCYPKPVVTFSGGERESCVLAGFTITDGNEGIYCSGTSPTITNCSIVGNKDAGIESRYVPGWRRSPTVISCTVTDNEGAGIMARGRKTPTIINCLIAGNKKAGIDGDNDQIVANCTVVENALCGISCYNGAITNCIIRDNLLPQIEDYGSATSVTYSNVQGGWSGEGNIDADPCFVEPGYWEVNGVWFEGDYHLLAGSPSIDAGDNKRVPLDTADLDGDGNTAEPIPFDLDDNARIVDGDGDDSPVVDMGAYEFFVPPIAVAMRFTPQALNPGSKGNWVKAHLVLPEGYMVEDVDTDTPAEIEQLGIQSEYMNVFVNEEGLVEIEAAFGRADFCGSGPFDGTITVSGLLTSGQRFVGTDTIKIVTNNLKYLGGFASHWLEAGCGEPDWCGGFDLNQDTVVNFADFALFDGCCIEIITK